MGRSRRTLALVANLMLASATAVGCNALSGIEDFTVQSDASHPLQDGTTTDVAADAAERDATNVGDSTDAGDASTEARDASTEATAVEAGDAPSDDLVEANDASTTKDAPANCGTKTCATPLCCDGGCATAHSNGLGDYFYDCAPLSTFNAAEALAACGAFTGDASLCTTDPTLCLSGDQVCSTGASTCACWGYDNLNAGHVAQSTTCQCAAANSPTWN